MSNVFLWPFYKNLHLQIAQTIFADNRAQHIGKLSFNNETCSMDLGLINTCKNFSLPVTILNQNFEVSKYCDKLQSTSQIYSEMDVLISFLNLSSMDYEERYNLTKQMQQRAPKALFIEYENPERNMAYPMYYSLIAGEYLSSFGNFLSTRLNKKLKNNQDLCTQNIGNKTKHLKEYLKNGGLEGFMYDIPNQTGISPRIIKREHLYMGGIGLAYCEW